MNTFSCSRCDGTGFLNVQQVDEDVRARFEETRDSQVILDWIDEMAARAIRAGGGCSCHISAPCSYCLLQHDVQVCDCCNGSGEHDWNNPDDSKGCR
ncbi:MAG: hypothetical protein ABFC88_12495 [Thermoguttaceae bacterium]